MTIDDLLARLESQISAKTAALARRLARRLRIETRHLSRALAEPIEAVRAEDSGPRLAAQAVSGALTQAKQHTRSIDFLIGHTATPHTLLPSNTAWTADELGFAGPHVELRQACTGFAAAFMLATGLQSSGFGCIALVGSETGSVYFDPRRLTEDAGQLVNLVQMGDGAGAILLGAHADDHASRIERPFFGSRGVGRAPALMLAEGGSGSPCVAVGSVATFVHRHKAVRTHGLELLRASLQAALATGVDTASVDWFLPHQANGRMAEICATHLGVPAQRVVCEAGAVGNLGSAAIWVTLDRLRRSGRLAIGDRVLVLGAEATKYLFGGFLYVHGNT
jgi:3-oxoacyl-[acyl-carrier-protein] synthase-3